MKEKHIPVGIYNNEVFIAEFDENGNLCTGCNGKPLFGVLRPVSEEQLESYRDPYQREEEYKDLWREAVHEGQTEDGFSNWFEGVWSEEFDENDPEDFPGRDDSDTQYLVNDDRLKADRFLETRGIDVASYTCGGSYPPDMDVYHRDGDSWYSDFKEWDYVFPSKEAEELAADFVRKYARK